MHSSSTDNAIPLGSIPREPEGLPVFAEPWHAHVFALVLQLRAAGVFGWKEWGDMIAAGVDATQEAETADGLHDLSYGRWLSALQALLSSKGLLAHSEVHIRQEEWLKAYLNTPHGQPVALENAARSLVLHQGGKDPCLSTDHCHLPKRAVPIAISPAVSMPRSPATPAAQSAPLQSDPERRSH